MVIDEVAIPSARTGDVPAMILFAATAVPPIKIAGPPDMAKGVSRLIVLDSAFVDFRVQLDTPAAELREHTP